MTSRPRTKSRIVKCPKCKAHLVESENLTVYECGGCGTALQAKNRNKGGTCSDTPGKDPSLKNEPEHEFEGKELTSANPKGILISPQDFSSDLYDVRDRNRSGNFSKENSGGTEFLNGIPSSAELTLSDNGSSSSGSGGIRESNETNENGLNFTSSSPSSQLTSSEHSSTLLVQSPLEENVAVKCVNSALSEQLDKVQETVCEDLEDKMSEGTEKTTEIVNCSCISEEPGDQNRNVTISPVTGSSDTHDGSVSYGDGLGDQLHDGHFKPSERTFSRNQRVEETDGTKEESTRDNVPMINNKIAKNSGLHHRMKKDLSISTKEKDDAAAAECTNYDCDESPETTRCGIQAQRHYPFSEGFHPIRNSMSMHRGGYQSREPFYPSGSLSSYENGSSSSQANEAFSGNSCFYSPEKTDYHEEDRMDILRMVDELREQLKRSYSRSEKANGRACTRVTRQEKLRPLYYRHKLPEEILYCRDAKYPPGGCRTRHTRSQQYELSQIPLSRQAANCVHHSDYPCLNCYSKEWQCPLQFPPHGLCCNKGLCVIQPGHVFYGPYRSDPASPHQHMESDFPIPAHDRQSLDQRNKDHKVNRLYVRERRQTAKRHCLPFAAGAPFITCHRCLKLLQLPADFLLSRKRCHRLRCGACLEVLQFSLHNRNHLVPYSPNAHEVHSSTEATTSRIIASTSHGNPRQNLVSSFEDYGPSFCKSSSTEGEPPFQSSPFPSLKSSTGDRMNPSNTSNEPMKQGKKAFKQCRNKHKNPVEASEFGSPSSEAEPPPPTAGSPLHRLMGYSSPSEMINGSDSYDDIERSP